MAARLRSLPWAISLGLVLGGAVGNLTDRIFRAPGVFVGHVVDMVSLFDPYGQVWPIFNLADSALVCGVVLAVLLEVTGRQRDGSRLRRPAGDPVTIGTPRATPGAPETARDADGNAGTPRGPLGTPRRALGTPRRRPTPRRHDRQGRA